MMTFDPDKVGFLHFYEQPQKPNDSETVSPFGHQRVAPDRVEPHDQRLYFGIFYHYFSSKQLPPPVRTTLLSAVPVIPRPPVAPVVRLAPGQVIAPMPPMIPPRINVVPLPPNAPHIMAPRPPPMVVPAGKTDVVKSKQIVIPLSLLNFVITNMTVCLFV